MSLKTSAMFLEDIPLRRVEARSLEGKEIISEWNHIPNGTKEDWDAYISNVLADNGLTEEDMEYIALNHNKTIPEMLYISDHAAKRLKERGGFNKKAMLRMVIRAYNEGRRDIGDDAYLTEWLKQRKAASTMDSVEIILYGPLCYIFRKDVLVTVMHIPSKEKALSDPSGKSYKHKRSTLRYQLSY